MNAVNYDERMRALISEGKGGKLLLHSCCAPCSSYCLKETAKAFRVTVFYYNPNLDCEAEYVKRKSEQLRFLRETGYADFLDCDYSPEEFAEAVEGYEQEPEGGARCSRCFRLRLEKTARAAKAGGFDYFGTTLTVSPLKNAALINEIGYELQDLYGVKYCRPILKNGADITNRLRFRNNTGCIARTIAGVFIRNENEAVAFFAKSFKKSCGIFFGKY